MKYYALKDDGRLGWTIPPQKIGVQVFTIYSWITLLLT